VLIGVTIIAKYFGFHFGVLVGDFLASLAVMLFLCHILGLFVALFVDWVYPVVTKIVANLRRRTSILT
jgi:hypothetical protein